MDELTYIFQSRGQEGTTYEGTAIIMDCMVGYAETCIFESWLFVRATWKAKTTTHD